MEPLKSGHYMRGKNGITAIYQSKVSAYKGVFQPKKYF